MSTQPKLKSVRTIARETAKWIRKNGHYQSGKDLEMYGSVLHPNAPCCLIQNPAFDQANNSVWNQFEEIIKKVSGSPNAIEWNDNTSTEDVLATLDRIAAGELK